MGEITLEQATRIAAEHFQAGRLPEAESLCGQILAVQAGHPDALHLLGLVAHRVGRHAEAAGFITRSLAAAPRNVFALSNLGTVRQALGQWTEAQSCYEQALAVDPGFIDARQNLGHLWLTFNRPGEARQCFERVLALQPAHADALNGLGNALLRLGQPDGARPCFERALALRPDDADAAASLGHVLINLGRPAEARQFLEKALTLRPDHPDAHNNLGVLLFGLGEPEQARGHFERTLALRPDHLEALNNLGGVLSRLGLPDQAMPLLARAVELQPGFANAHQNLGNLHIALNRPGEARACFERALALQPAHPDALNGLGVALIRLGLPDEARLCFERALVLQPLHVPALNSLGNLLQSAGQIGNALVYFRRAVEQQRVSAAEHGNFILALHYSPATDAATLRAECGRWHQRHGAPWREARARPHANAPDPERRLRIGYLSPDFRSHAVSRFIAPVFAAHDHARFEVHGYANVSHADAVTARLRSLARGWTDVTTLSDAALAEQVRADGIDILVDLALHTAQNRLPVFNHGPAPVQVCWLGCVGTSGLESIGYRFSDARLEPPGGGDRGWSSEEIAYLPEVWCCYEPPAGENPVGPLPARDGPAAGSVTFGSRNNFTKCHDGVLRLWARVLAAVPGSRLRLRCPAGSARNRVRALLESLGLKPARLQFTEEEPEGNHLRAYDGIDLALDPFPYNGVTTTCEALWMGVPVVTLAGALPVARAGVSLLSAVGCPEWIAHDEDGYVRIAAALAGDLPRLAALRAGLRERMRRSPLLDAPRLTRHVEAAYRTMWRRWCATRRPPTG